MRWTGLFFCCGAALLLAGCSCEWFDSGQVDAGPTNGGVGDPCATVANCRSGLACAEDGTCQPAGAGVEGSLCTLTGDCGEGLYCGPSRSCVAAGDGQEGADCQSTSDCQPGLLCSLEGLGFRCRAAGEGDLGDDCATDLDCLAGLRCRAGDTTARVCLNPASFSGDAGVSGMPPPTLPAWEGQRCEVDEGPPTAYFHVPREDEDVDFYRLPFPNDVRRTERGLDLSGHPTPETALSIDVLGRTLRAAEQDLDGFATNPVIYFRFSRPYEWADVTGARVLLVDLSPDSPEFGRNLGRGWLTTAGAITRYICPDWLAIRRGHGAPLRPGTTYAAILLQGILTSEADGHRPFGRSSDLDAVLGAARPTEAPLARAWDAYAPLREYLARSDTPGAQSVLNATVFSTQTATSIVPLAREVIREAAPPALSDVTVCADGVQSPCDDGLSRRCGEPSPDYWEIHARVELPQLQRGTPPYETPEDGGVIARDAAGRPLVERTEPVCMVMTVPKVDAAPADGLPVVIYAHGTGGAFTAPLDNGLAAELARAAPAAATVGFDMPLHGSRRGGSERDPQYLVFNYANPRAARDTFLQGGADLMALVHWAESYVMSAAQAPGGFEVRFDPGRISLFAHSQGATSAQLVVPYEPGLHAVVLSGAGGDLTESLLTKRRPVDIASALPLALLDPDASGALAAGDHHPALALLQMFYERVDPVNYGRLYHREPVAMEPASAAGHHVFMTYGLGDTYSTERTQAAFARSASLPLVEPQRVDVGLGEALAAPASGTVSVGEATFTVGLRQYEPAAGEDGHFVSTRVAQARADVLRFLTEALAGEIPRIGE